MLSNQKINIVHSARCRSIGNAYTIQVCNTCVEIANVYVSMYGILGTPLLRKEATNVHAGLWVESQSKIPRSKTLHHVFHIYHSPRSPINNSV